MLMLRWIGLLAVTLALTNAPVAFAADAPSFDAESLEFFEKEVRPILVQRCVECHSGKLGEPKGGLRLDTREHALKGGDTGPAVVPGNLKESLLVDAINWGDTYQMPPKSKMPASEIAVLTKWIERGAPWPKEALASDDKKAKPFSIAERKASHWCWQPIQAPQPPAVKNSGFVKSPIDAFIAAKLEEKGLTPSEPADKRTLIRRAYFDLIGLPPTPAQVDAFVKDESPEAFSKVVDELLKSPRFGERWGRHWLDLMRYAESRGHEFDYDIPNAWQYRDYVIRALNADVPYDQFVTEHIAGDLLQQPRLNPEQKFNESIIGTGFWHLGEWVHSPVDIRKDECDRFDNMVDTFSKTFLAMTVSCARCHDHKFDAVSQKDYYALFGYLQSSDYRQARIDGEEQNREIAKKLGDLKVTTLEQVGELLADLNDKSSLVDQLPDYLLAAREAILVGGSTKNLPVIEAVANEKKLDRARLLAWVTNIEAAQNDNKHPLHVWAKLSSDKEASDPAKLKAFFAPLLAAKTQRDERLAKEWQNAKIVCDYRDKQTPWVVDGLGFGSGPIPAGEPILSNDASEPLVSGVAGTTAARFDRTWSGLKAAPGTQNDIGAIGGWDRIGKTLRTPTFEVTHRGQIKYLVQGAGRAFIVIDSHRLIQGPLHNQSLKEWNDDQTGQPRWIGQDLAAYVGHRVHIEFSPKGDADLQVVMVVCGEPPRDPLPGAETLAARLAGDSLQNVAKNVSGDLIAAFSANDPPPMADVLAGWMWRNPTCFLNETQLATWSTKLKQIADNYHAERAKLLAQVKWESRIVPVLAEGTGEDERLLVRGSHTTPRDNVPRQFLTAIVGEAPLEKAGSGRLELAEQMLAPNNPLTARVMVNRIWHHLLGRGIVPSVDNFGVLGQAPSHPELLDYLATEFRREGWSTKRMIRAIMLSSTYQMASTPGEADKDADPQNVLLHRANIRRLEGEVIRDQMLALSGRLNDRMYGPPVPVYLTQYMQGRGRPGGGPLDGDGRRSIYISVRRNFLSPMMLAFDTPSPASSMGRRNISNVPAQALTLMNDPLVVEQAKLWAKRILEDKAYNSPEERVGALYQQAFARPATSAEVVAALQFLEEQGKEHGLNVDAARQDHRTWGDLCHVMMNVKEFIFIP